MINFRKINYKDLRMIKNIISSLIIKGGGILISFFTIPAYINYFQSNDILGIWFTMLSMLSWILTLDLGIGNGLRNYLVKPIIDNDENEIKKYISSSYIIVGLITLIIFIVGYLGSSYINWNVIYNIDKMVISKLELLKIVRIIFFGILLQFFLRLNNSILYAMQKSTIPNILMLITNIFMLIFVLNFKESDLLKKLLSLAIFYVFATNFPLFIATVVIFLKKLRKSLPNINYFSMTHTRNILKLGGIFFWLQIMQILIYATNEFLITWLVSPSKVVEYQIYNKIFGLIGMFFQVGLTPIWSEVTEACRINDYSWISKLYEKLKKIVLASIMFQVLVIFIIQNLVDFWLKDKTIKINLLYSLVFVIWSMIYMFVTINATIVAGMEELKIALIFLTLGALSNFILAYFFVEIFDSWIGIILANILSLVPFCIIQPYYLKKMLQLKLLRRN